MKPFVAWMLVALQFVLITLLITIPQGTLWQTGLVAGVIAGVMLVGGIILGTISVIKLGRALTPNPIPRIDGHLETKGLYALVRHPIYSAVLLAMLGVVVWGAGVWHLVFYGLLLALLGVKARAEERYPEYADYGSRVGRFVPGVGKFR